MSTQYMADIIPVEQPHPTEASRKTLLENDEVLVVSTAYPSGASVPLHLHRFPQLAYVVEGGTIETTALDGAVGTYEVRAGETLWTAAAHAHSARNVGSTRVRIVEVEVKHARPATRIRDTRPRAAAPDTLEWVVDSFDPARTTALLVGDPTKPGPYTVRFRAPAGYGIGLHLHPDDDEQLTVLSGAIRWSTGEEGSGAPEYTLKAGGFALSPAGTPHRIVVVEDSELQMSGFGPRTYVYLDPADDPHRRR